MSRYFDDELTHSGVKGMKWRKHKYRLVKDANGKLRYVYDNDNTARKQTNGNDAARRMQQATQAKRILADVIKKGGDPNHSYTVGYMDKDGKLISGKYMPNDKSLSAVSFDKKGKVSPVYSKAAKELMADNKRKYEEHNRQERLRRSEANKEQIERRKRRRQSEANKEQIERRKRHRQAEANNQKAKATGKRAELAVDKPYQSKVEYDQGHQRYWLKERDKLRKKGEPSLITPPYGNESASKYHDEFYKDQQRNARRSMEGFETGLSERHNSPSLAGPGHRARAAESTARHKAAVKAQKEHTARTEEATARRKAATSKYVGERSAQQYKIKKTQEAAAEKRKKTDEWRKAVPNFESLGYSSNRYDTRATEYYVKGDSKRKDRFRNVPEFHYEPSKETKKRLRRNKRKKAVSDTKRAIDKGRKAVEEFFTPKKKKKR